VAILSVAFVWLARRHGQQRRRVAWLDLLARVNAEAASRVRRDWPALPDAEWRDADPDHPYAADLDLVGPASVAKLLPRVSSAPGREILRAWLLAPAPPADIRARQAAIAELAPLLDFRDALLAFGRRIWLSDRTQRDLERWAVGDPWLVRQPWLVGLTLALPMATLALGLGAIAGAVSSSLWLWPVAASVILTGIRSAALKRTLGPVADKTDALGGYAEMTKLVSDATFQSRLLRQLQAELARGDRPAHKALASLRVLADLSQVRSSPMLHMILQWLGLWDFHVTHAVERWQGSHGQHLAAWLNALGQVESLAALGALAHGNPTWTFPDVDPDATALDAMGLGHPLLAEEGRVTNDVTVGPAGTFLLVTGSNMSGKSTLLRAIGVNVVLAQAGAPVSATRFRAPPVALYTSMRIRDSLEKGVSYFMAEVLRLKQIVEATRSADGSRPIVMYLFDEVLQGTNANERTVAAQRILDFFASANAIGALATHDLRLLDSASVSRAAKLVHFREDVVRGPNGPVLHFDYRLRPGPASSTNALRLMELAGLPVAEP
jgi:MutS domain V